MVQSSKKRAGRKRKSNPRTKIKARIRSAVSSAKAQLKATKRSQRQLEKERSKSYRASLKEFRHKVAVLRRKGLIPKAVLAREARKTKGLVRLTKEYSDVIEGLASVKYVPIVKGKSRRAKARRKQYALVLENYRVADYRVRGRRIIIAKPTKESRVLFRPSKGRHEIVREVKYMQPDMTLSALPAGIHEIHIPIKYENLHQYLTDLSRLEQPLEENQLIGMRIGPAWFRYSRRNQLKAENVARKKSGLKPLRITKALIEPTADHGYISVLKRSIKQLLDVLLYGSDRLNQDLNDDERELFYRSLTFHTVLPPEIWPGFSENRRKHIRSEARKRWRQSRSKRVRGR